MAVNKVVYSGDTLIDLSGDSVSPLTLAEGVTAHAADGTPIVGVAPTDAVRYTAQTLTETQQEQARSNIDAVSSSHSHDFSGLGFAQTTAGSFKWNGSTTTSQSVTLPFTPQIFIMEWTYRSNGSSYGMAVILPQLSISYRIVKYKGYSSSSTETTEMGLVSDTFSLSGNTITINADYIFKTSLPSSSMAVSYWAAT